MGLFGLGKPNIKDMKNKKDIVGLIKIALGERKFNVRRKAIVALGELGESAVEELILILKDKNVPPIVLPNSVDLMTYLKNRSQYEIDRERFLNYFQYKSRVALALGAIGDPRAVETLIGALKGEYVPDGAAHIDEKIWIRGSAARALGKIRDARAIKPLIQLMTDKNVPLDSVIDALGEIGKPAVKPLVKIMKDKDLAVRNCAKYVLEEVKKINSI